MDYATAAIFFLLGLGVYLLVTSLARRGRGGKGLEGLPMKDGAVRVDRMVSRPGGEGREAGAVEETSTEEAPPEAGRRVPSRRAKGGRRRR